MTDDLEGAEFARLAAGNVQQNPWRRWGPYLSERQWGTVREDYSEDGDAWRYFTHDQARSRTYQWGEDGLAGLSDEEQRLCFALAFWNGRDPILKERLFGLANAEGNHGEDVKEYYFYLDATPTHSYMKWLYKYPQRAFPYTDLVDTNAARTRHDLEYELLDTGVFDDDRYFDIFVEYAKAAPEDVLIRVTAVNRGPDAAVLHVLPTLWFRNTWRWRAHAPVKPRLEAAERRRHASIVAAWHPELGDRWLYFDGAPPLLFTENETNNERIFGTANTTPYVKDAFHAYLVDGTNEAINPAATGTKAAGHYHLDVPPGQWAVFRLRLTELAPDSLARPFSGFDEVFAARKNEADAFYAALTPGSATEDAARVMRQSFAGLLWTKQWYGFDVNQSLRERRVDPFGPRRRPVRNREWFHMSTRHVISMPDKWEYPWYAAWDLAFQAVAFAPVDVDFAKEQLLLLLKENYQHPNGQIPAYEWNFSDVNPPVHAWAAIFVYRLEQAQRGRGDIDFLKRSFGKLLLNFTWWANRKDRAGRSVFEGGFLGLDNIGVFDRRAPLPTGGWLEQADGTAWMALFCQNMLEIAAELAARDAAYEDLAAKFAAHFLGIGASLNHVGLDGMWDEEDGFYYDVLRFPDGSATRLKVRSLVGLLPLCATTVVEPWEREQVPHVVQALGEQLRGNPDAFRGIHPVGAEHQGVGGRTLLAIVNTDRLRRILAWVLDESEFLAPYGVRSISRWYERHPYVFHVDGVEYRVEYRPAESDTAVFGGNANWRGPIWFPVNALIIRALLQFHLYYGDGFRIECPTGSGRLMNLFEVAGELSHRLQRIFLRDDSGRRPVFGGTSRFQTDPNWRDHLLFYEYFHGDNGAGLGASHQTGWTALVAVLIRLFGTVGAAEAIASGKAAVGEVARSSRSETAGV